MSHARTQVRDAVAAAVTGLATTGANVHVDRAFNLQKADLPALRVYVTGEIQSTSAMRQSFGPALRRECTVVVQIYVKGADPSDQIDQILSEVETALAADATIRTLIEFLPAEFQASPPTATDVPLAEAFQSFRAVYRTGWGAPDTRI
jgi:hypothetical protein